MRVAKRRAARAERVLGGHLRRQPHVSGQSPILLSALPHPIESKPLKVCAYRGSRENENRGCHPDRAKTRRAFGPGTHGTTGRTILGTGPQNVHRAGNGTLGSYENELMMLLERDMVARRLVGRDVAEVALRRRGTR